MNSLTTITAHIARSRELASKATDWKEYSNEYGDWGIADKSGLVLFSMESKSLPFDQCNANIKFVDASRTILPQYVEALSVAVDALKYAHKHSDDPVAFWLEEALSKIAAILSP